MGTKPFALLDSMNPLDPMKSSDVVDRVRSVNPPSLNRHVGPLPTWAAVVLGGLLLASSTSLHGQVLYSGIKDIVIPAGFDGVYLDLDTGTSSTSAMAGWDLNPFFGGYAIANSAAFQPVRVTAAADSMVLNLAPGTIVGMASMYATAEAGSEGHIGVGLGQFAAGSEGYVGFQFTPQGGAGPWYGWMRLVLTVNQSGGWIRDWAYDTTGTALAVGVTAVPEPRSVAIGTAAALALWVGIRRLGKSR